MRPRRRAKDNLPFSQNGAARVAEAGRQPHPENAHRYALDTRKLALRVETNTTSGRPARDNDLLAQHT